MQISTQFLGLIMYGVQWVLWLLIGLSIASVAVMLERFWYFATYRKDEKALAGDIAELLRRSSARPGPAGQKESGYPEVLAAAAEGAKVRERLALERNLAFLGTLGSNAPFIGLFGTVLGIIKAFHDLAGNQTGGPAVVMAGISEALVATAVGLMVAIPAVVSFNYFNRRVRTTMTQVDWMIELALAQLRASEPAGDEIATADKVPARGRGTPAALPGEGWPRRIILGLAAAVLVLGGLLVEQRSRTQPVLLPNAPVTAQPEALGPDGGHLDERADRPAAAEPPAATPAPANAPTAAPAAAPMARPFAAAVDPPAPPAKASRLPKGKKKRASAAPEPLAPTKQKQLEVSAATKPADAASSPAAPEVP